MIKHFGGCDVVVRIYLVCFAWGPSWLLKAAQQLPGYLPSWHYNKQQIGKMCVRGIKAVSK
jgi:hypothetical protein